MNLEEFEEHLHKRFNDHKAHDLTGDRLWGFINRELAQEEKKRFTTPLYLWLALGLFVIVVLAGSVYGNLTASQKVSNTPVAGNKTIIPHNGRSAEKKNDWSATQALSASVSSDTAHTTTTATRSIKPPPLVHVYEKSSLPDTASSTLVQESNAFFENRPNGLGSSNEDFIKPTITTPVIENTTKKLNRLPALSTRVNSSNVHEPMPLAPLPLLPTAQKSTRKLMIGLGAGPSFSTLGFRPGSSPYALLRHQTEKPQLGWQATVDVFHKNKPGLIYGTGLTWNKTWTKFRYENEQPQETHLENTLVQVLIDQTTLDTIGKRFGSVTIEETNLREVQHYNQSSTLSIPVHIGFLKETSRVSLGIVGGLAFNYRLQQQGRILDEQQNIVDFRKGTFFKKVGFSAHVRPMFLLALRNGISLSVSPSLQFSLTDQLLEGATLSQRPFNYAFSVGIAKSFLQN